MNLLLCTAALDPAICPADNLLSLSGPLTGNPAPFALGGLGELDIGGALSGYGSLQTSPSPENRDLQADIANAELFFQKSSGGLQFFLAAGGYSFPSLGTPYAGASHTPDKTYGWAPVAFLKIAPSSDFSIQAGKLPSLTGNESLFTIENVSVERGLLWNQTSSVSRGAQLNYTQGPLAFSVSWNDGYYSGRFNWLTGSATYSLGDGAGSLTLIGGANLGHTAYSSFATPLAQNNSAIGDLVYNLTAGRWTLSPYIQASHMTAIHATGLEKDASTLGAAMLVSCKPDGNWSAAVRAEALQAQGGLNVLHGPGSEAWSLTLTPAYQKGVFFARAEASYVGVANGKTGFGLGRNLDTNEQARLMLETGVLF